MADPTPTPRTLYVHDDLSELLVGRDETSPARRLGQALLARLAAEPSRIVVLTVQQQLHALIARGDHAPFEGAVGIGPAGARVAAQVHARTGWFPVVHRVDVWREETANGEYVLAAPAPLADLLGDLRDVVSLAIVDDTIFSGFTMRTVLEAIRFPWPPRVHVFCLRAVAETLVDLATRTVVTPGVVAPGRLLTDVSFINASGLVRRGAIRRAHGPSLAFFERPEWMAAWFPDDHAAVTALCHDLCLALEETAVARR